MALDVFSDVLHETLRQALAQFFRICRRRAMATASERVVAPSLENMALRCCLTALCDTPSIVAISLLVSPLASEVLVEFQQGFESEAHKRRGGCGDFRGGAFDRADLADAQEEPGGSGNPTAYSTII